MKHSRPLLSLAIAISLLLAGCWPSPTPTPLPSPTPMPMGTVMVRLKPSSSSVRVGDVFVVEIGVEAGNQQVDGVEVHLNFDPTYLQVVNSLADAGSTLSAILLNQADNAVGHLDYAAGTLSSFPSGAFVLATVRLKALRETVNDTGTPLTFVYDIPNNRITDVTYGGRSVFGGAADGYVRIAAQ